MKFKKNKFIALAMIISTIGLVGCQNDSSNDGSAGIVEIVDNLPDAQMLVHKATDTMTSLDSVSSNLEVEVKMIMWGEPLDTTTIIKSESFENPVKAKLQMEATSQVEGGEMTVMDMYVEDVDGIVNTHLNSENEWHTQKNINKEDLVALLPHKQAIDILPTMFDITLERGFIENDIRKFEVVGSLDYPAMYRAADANGTIATAEMMGMSSEEFRLAIENIDNTEARFIIDEDGFIYSYSIDMSEMLEVVMNTEEIFGMVKSELDAMGMSIGIEEAIVNIDMYDFNNVSDFDIPSEAYNVE